MPLLAKLLSFNALRAPTKKKTKNPYIRYNVDPYTEWEKIGELGDGAFGKVYKVPLVNFTFFTLVVIK